MPVAMLTGWTECFRTPYPDQLTTLASVLLKCSGSKLMFACAPHASNMLNVLAWAPRTDVTTFVAANVCHAKNVQLANGVNWYYDDTEAIGFLQAGDVPDLCPCDISGVNGQYRLCWHANSGHFNPGFRCGTNTGLNNDSSWDRIIYQIQQAHSGAELLHRSRSSRATVNPPRTGTP